MDDNNQAVSQPLVDTQSAPIETPVQGVQGSQANIPYGRFKEVIDQKNQLAQKVAQYEQYIQASQPSNGVNPGINTVDDLVGAIKNVVGSELSDIKKAYQQQEIEKRNTKIIGNAERYFSDPNKGQVREEMLAVYNSMTPKEQVFIDEQILNGNYRMMDAIYYQVLAERGQQAQQVTQQNVNSMAQAAQQPQPFRVIRQGEPTLDELKSKAFQTGNFSDVFKAIAPK